MASAYHRGNKAFTVAEVEAYLRRVDVATTGELADRFDVTGAAIRKRLKPHPRIRQRKIRRQYVWYVPHRVSVPPSTVDAGDYP